MTEAISSERRTRSQLILPDNILQQLSHRSPLKDARTALRNYTVADDTSSLSKNPSDDTDDELLLSPGKNEIEMKITNNSKRSASPASEDEYSPRTSSPSSGRELKRFKRELIPGHGESDIENNNVVQLLHRRLTPGHARNNSEPNILPGQRPARKRSATTSKKPISTVSASPPTSAFSPAISPKKGRAQSVPLFLSTQDIPHIDFRNPPPSPKRSRSPSRSPSKDREPKLRITSATFPKAKLPTIQDEPPTKMDVVDDTSGVPEEAELPPLPETPTDGQSSSCFTADKNVTPPTPSTSTIEAKLLIIPATPASRSLNRLIPMSPLTPLPETPFPARLMSAANAESRFVNNPGWGVTPAEEPAASSQTLKPLIPIELPVNKSRLPRLTIAPPPPPPHAKPPMAAPGALMSKFNGKSATVGKREISTAPKKDAFAVLMKKPLEQKERMEKEKARLMKEKGLSQASKPALPSIFTSLAKGKEKAVGPADKPRMKMKEKMRPREKPKAKRTPLLIPLPDEENEEEQSEAESSAQAAGEDRILEPAPSSVSPEPIEPPMPVTEDSIMAAPQKPEYPEPVEAALDRDATMVEAGDDTEPDDGDNGDILPATNSEAPPAVPSATADNEAMGKDSSSHNAETSAPEVAVASERQGDESSKTEEQFEANRHPLGASKLPLGKKRQPTTVVPANRVTRSVSNRQKDKGVEGSQFASTSGPSRKKAGASTGPAPVLTKRTASGAVKKPAPVAEASQNVATDPMEESNLPPGSPMQMSSPPKATKSHSAATEGIKTINYGAGKPSLAMTPTKSRFAEKPASSPSPSKIARATSLFSIKPSASSISRTFSMDLAQSSTSSLSTLSNALEKLRMPPPSRPNTSMGFNRDAPGDDDFVEPPNGSQDDGTVGRASLGMGRPEGGLKRAATLGANAFKATAINAAASSSKSGTSGKNLMQKPLSMFMSNKGQSGTGAIMRGTGRSGPLVNKPSIFGVGGGLRRTISKKTSLPMVVGSPVKGGTADTTMQEYENDMEDDAKAHTANDADVFMTPANASTGTLLLEDLEVEVVSSKGKEKATSSRSANASRRVSMVSQALSQSLSALPPPSEPTNRGLMGPPATPPSGRAGLRSTSSSYPSTATSGGSPSQAGSSMGTRSSARIAKSAPGALMKIKGGINGLVSSGKKGAAEPAPAPNPAVEALKVLKDCVIFVDVKTDDGDEAGSLFVEMLEGVGARVLTRVGQTCTHIVYKNGLMSTLTRYRLLRDPKPFVVGIGWVVECVEQRNHVDETNFLVDLDGVNVAGTNKRRRSMLPKLFATELSLPPDADKDDGGDGDRSMDGSTSSVTMEDGLTPLERARRRKRTY